MSPNTHPRTDLRRPLLLTALMLAGALWTSGPSIAATPPVRVLVVEPVGADLWRAEAAGQWLQFALDRTAGVLEISFVTRGGEAMTAPPTRSVSLTAPKGRPVLFTAGGAGWRSPAGAGPPVDGATLNIVEADHRHDFRLNVHAAAASSPTVRP
jgi:hypothetical protein